MRWRALCLAAVMLTAITACSTPGGDSGVPPTSAATSASQSATSTTSTPSTSAPSATPTTGSPMTSSSSATSTRTSTTTKTSTTSTTTSTTTTRPPTSTTSTTTTTTNPLSAWLGKDWERLPTSQKVFALTFDAGASDAGVSSILSTLASRNVRATFFVTGQFARTYPGAVRAIARAGYPVGNHSDTHPHFPELTNTQIALELSRAEASITPLTGKAAKPLFRFPFGDREQLDITVVNRLGYIPFRWTVDSLGWQGTESTAAGSAAAVCERVVDAAVPGGIALMHVGANPDDGTTFDANALPCIITGIKALGYRFVDLPSQLP